MKKIFYLILTSLIMTFFVSCATAITVGKNVPAYKVNSVYDSPKMEFIGFKIDTNILSITSNSKVSTGFWGPKVDNVMSEFDQAKAIANTKSLRQLGFNLENNKIANNKADSYFGIYSLQELELYKSNTRYVTFIEVAENTINYKDNRKFQSIMGGIGRGFLAAGTPLLTVGAIYKDDKYVTDLANAYMTTGGICLGASVPFLALILLPTKTNISFTGLYNIYIYDTETKSLIRKESVSVNCEEQFKGAYTYDDSSKEIVHDYISQNVYNSILRKYDELNQWLETR